MQPLKGLYRDCAPLEQPDGTYPYGKNGIQFDLKGAITNEPGFKLMNNATIPYTVCGIIETDYKPLIFSTNNTYSAIGYFNPDTELYEPIVNDATLSYKLNFNTQHYITGQTQRNYKSELVCAFTDKHTFPKYLNCDAAVTTKPDSIEDWYLFPFYNAPLLKTSIQSGGNLQAGTYFVSAKYQKNDGTTTMYGAITGGKTVISTDGKTQDKSIQITATNLDLNYDFIIFCIIAKVNGVTTAVEMSPINITKVQSVTAVYNQDVTTTTISLEEVLVEPAVYKKVGTIGQLNDELYIADLTVEDEVNLQTAVNSVKVVVTSKLVDCINLEDKYKNGEEKGFMHDEVYAIYLRFKIKNGKRSKAFHIPGPKGVMDDYRPSDYYEEFYGTEIVNKRFKLIDTNVLISGTTKKCYTGVYQNDTELYPATSDFANVQAAPNDSTGVLVRHHKMPSYKYCKANYYSTDDSYLVNKMDLLGISIENLTIPSQYQNMIEGYEIMYAKRTVQNMTVYGTSLMHYLSTRENEYHNGTNTDDVPAFYSTGGPFDSYVEHNASTDFDTDSHLLAHEKTFKFYGFDLLFNKPSVTPFYIKPLYLLGILDLENPSSNGIYQDGVEGSSVRPIVALFDYTQKAPWSGNVNINNVVSFSTYNHGIQIKSSTYLPNNINVGKYVNEKHENSFVGTLTHNILPGSDKPADGIVGIFGWSRMQRERPNRVWYGSSGLASARKFITPVISLCDIKSDVYFPFTSQQLITDGVVKALNNTEPVFIGDVYVGPYTFHTYGRNNSLDNVEGSGDTENYQGKKLIHRFLCESVSNISARFEIAGNQYSKWFPNNPLFRNADNGGPYPEFWDRTLDCNQFGYSKDSNALNDFSVASIFNTYQENLTLFPFRIHRSGKLSRQSKYRSWQSFLPLDYYECQKNMGRIVRVEGLQDKLLIHHEYSLFVTQNKAVMDSSGVKVTLGSGDIFQFPPIEVVPTKLGYAGTQHELAVLNCPAGYIFVNAVHGEIYIYDGKQLDNISNGLSLFFRDYLRMNEIYNNNFVGDAITIGYDQKYKRLILTVNNINNNTSFTCSYSLESKAWVFFHDYFPNLYFHTVTNLWLLAENSIYKVNADVPGKYINQSVRKPFFIDVVFRNGKDLILECLNWVTELLDSAGTGETEFITVSSVAVWNSRQHSGVIPITEDNSRSTQGVWSFNDFRNVLKDRPQEFVRNLFYDFALIDNKVDLGKSWFEKDLLEDKYFIVRLSYNNSNGYKLVLHDINADVLQSNR